MILSQIILLNKDRLPKIADFGFSKFNLHKTIDDFVDSNAYMIKGYSFGILVYEIMTLKKLYDGINVWNLGINDI